MTTILPNGECLTEAEEAVLTNWSRKGVTIHEPVDIHPTAELAPGVTVWPFSTVCEGVTVGRGTVIGARAYIGRGTVVGKHCRINDGSHLTDRMTVGDRVFFGAGVLTANDRHPRVLNPEYVVEPPIIEDGVSLGNGANILPGVRLGRGCMIAAGAVVRKDVAPGTLVAGNPARVVPCQGCDQEHPVDATHAPQSDCDLASMVSEFSYPGPQAVLTGMRAEPSPGP